MFRLQWCVTSRTNCCIGGPCVASVPTLLSFSSCASLCSNQLKLPSSRADILLSLEPPLEGCFRSLRAPAAGLRCEAERPGEGLPERAPARRRLVKTNAAEGAHRMARATDAPATVATAGEERTAVDAAMEGMSFGELCNEFECISSPAVEATARQLARDILEIRENRRQLSNFGVFVKYKDPLRSFTGREKYKRPSWLLDAVDKPTAAILQMVMRSPGVLNIRWRVRGRLRFPPASVVGGDLVLTVSSTFTLNQISGQVTEHADEWNLGGSSPLTAAYFWSSRLAWTVNETGKDASDVFKAVFRFLERRDDMSNIYADPTDPRKFFQETNPNSELYQIGLVVALLYLLVSFLRLVL